MPNFKKFLIVILGVVPVPLFRLIWQKYRQRKKFIYENDPDVFAQIYKNNYWGSSESRSGHGSQINATNAVRNELPAIWERYGIKTFLDVPCGDYTWMKEVKKDDLIYIGGDIVNEIIEGNKRYKNDNVSFLVLDITKGDLPKVDMIFCRDCLQHLSYDSVWKALKNFKDSGSRYLMVTTYPLTYRNWDICDGDYRPLNLERSPFYLPPPMLKVHENRGGGTHLGRDKHMFLYELQHINV